MIKKKSKQTFKELLEKYSKKDGFKEELIDFRRSSGSLLMYHIDSVSSIKNR